MISWVRKTKLHWGTFWLHGYLKRSGEMLQIISDLYVLTRSSDDSAKITQCQTKWLHFNSDPCSIFFRNWSVCLTKPDYCFNLRGQNGILKIVFPIFKFDLWNGFISSALLSEWRQQQLSLHSNNKQIPWELCMGLVSDLFKKAQYKMVKTILQSSLFNDYAKTLLSFFRDLQKV